MYLHNLLRCVAPLAPACLVVAFAFTGTVEAQTCFWYSDNINAATPIKCVQKSDLVTPCSWPSDCTTVEATGTTQTVLKMHEIWHQCFGSVGGATPPSGRGQRWYAFHRQFEYDFNLWRVDNGFAVIEQLDWCPGMNLPVAHDGAGLPSSGPGSHPDGCGVGPGRPANVPCDVCIAFPHCLFFSGGGPIACPTAPSSSCSAGGVSFTHTALEDFENVDDVAKLLDASFHGQMHGAIWVADLAPACGDEPFPDPDCIYNGDTLTSDCSPRDPMFWRLHKALDDVVRAWQDNKAVDLMVVIDRSGSMGGSDPSGVSKLEAAVRATEYFADMLDHNRSDGQVNRIGLVTYSSTANQKLALTDATPTLLNPGGAFDTAINQIRTDGVGGCTSIGAGIEKALEELCPNAGDCSLNPQPAPAGTNARKAILLLTDGVENIPPCLQSAGASGGTCGTECFGSSIDYDDLEFTQFVAIGFGHPGALNEGLLTLLAERQGGIYVNNPGAPGDDLKKFYTMAFGQLTDEFLAVDPSGTLASADLVSPPVEYTSCGRDGKITYTSGWDQEVTAGDLRLVVERPDGSLLQPPPDALQEGIEGLWAYQRIGAPDTGTWRGHLIRPHQQFFNGFAPDAFVELDDGVTIVLREIHRLCPQGCEQVLLYENGVDAEASAYQVALQRELATGLLGSVVQASDARDFDTRLGQSWDLIVYGVADGGSQTYDGAFSQQLCAGQRAIVTDLRSGNVVLECAGALTGGAGWTILEGDGRLVDGQVAVGLGAAGVANGSFSLGSGVQATANSGSVGAIVARGTSGIAQEWFISVLVQGLGKLSPTPMGFDWQTGDSLKASARILAPYHLAGGWDHVDARVEVTYPTQSLGEILAYGGSTPREGEELSAQLSQSQVPTKTAFFPLYDDGTNGDVTPGNGQWTTTLTGLGDVDGNYKLRYLFELTAGGCTTYREATQSLVVTTRVEQQASQTQVTVRDGDTLTVRLRPGDGFGNLWGPGKPSFAGCAPAELCRVRGVKDLGRGEYEVELAVDHSVPGVRLSAFDTVFDLETGCKECPALYHLKLGPTQVDEHSRVEATVVLGTEAADQPSSGVTVFLDSSKPQVIRAPATVVVPPGARSATFTLEVLHTHHGPEQVDITARLGDSSASGSLFVRPIDKGEVEPFRMKEDHMPMMSKEFLEGGHH